MEPAPNREVSWAAVVGGVLLALFIGVFVNVISLIVAVGTVGEVPFLGFVIGLGLPATFFWLTYSQSRDRGSDFRRGWLIGGCIAVLIAGACSSLFLLES